MDEVDVYAHDVTQDVADTITALQAEVARLRNIEALRDLAEDEAVKLRARLTVCLLEKAHLSDQLDEMSTDMSLMENQIRELSGREPGGQDFGP